MGLTIHVTQPVGRGWFTSGEGVQGAVVCNGISNVSKIIVYLEGQLRLSTRNSTESKKDLGGVHHALFVRQNTLYTARGSGSESIPDTIHFTLNFPEGGKADADVEGKDCAQCQQALPPSFHMSEAFNASVNYRIRAVAERSGILNPDNTAVQNVEFRPMLPTRTLPLDQPLKVSKQLDGALLGVKADAGAEKPMLACEFTFPASRVVRPGNHIDIGINFVIPVEIQRLWKRIWISQLVIRLRTKSVAAIGGGGKSHVSYTDVCSVRGLYPLELPGEYPRVAVSPQLWQLHIYPFIAPSLRLCKMQRNHALEIHIKFASKSARSSQSVETQFDVIVESGAVLNLNENAHVADAPPAYHETIDAS